MTRNISKDLGGGGSGGKVQSVASNSLQIEDIYDVGKLLGSGVAGEVHSARHKETGAKVAIKTISKKKFLVNERSVTTTRVRDAFRFLGPVEQLDEPSEACNRARFHRVSSRLCSAKSTS